MGGDQFTPEEIAEAERRFEEAHGRALGGGGGAVGGAAGGAEGGGPGPVHVLPLYAMLPQVGRVRCRGDGVQGCAAVLEAFAHSVQATYFRAQTLRLLHEACSLRPCPQPLGSPSARVPGGACWPPPDHRGNQRGGDVPHHPRCVFAAGKPCHWCCFNSACHEVVWVCCQAASTWRRRFSGPA